MMQTIGSLVDILKMTIPFVLIYFCAQLAWAAYKDGDVTKVIMGLISAAIVFWFGATNIVAASDWAFTIIATDLESSVMLNYAEKTVDDAVTTVGQVIENPGEPQVQRHTLTENLVPTAPAQRQPAPVAQPQQPTYSQQPQPDATAQAYQRYLEEYNRAHSSQPVPTLAQMPQYQTQSEPVGGVYSENTQAVATPIPPTQPSQGGPSNMYTVKRGDSLYKIAQSKLGSGERWRELCQINYGGNQSSCDNLRVGETLRLPVN